MKKEVVCSRCGFTILIGMEFVKHEKSGAVLCMDCYKETFDDAE